VQGDSPSRRLQVTIGAGMELYEVIRARHTIRAFKPQPVDSQILLRLVDAAAAAPSSMNAQPWMYHIATGTTRHEVGQAMAESTLHLKDYIGVLDEKHLKDAEQFFATLGDAPVAIALSVPVPVDELDRINSYVAAGCSLENMQLAAVVEGLGCCSITFSFWVRDRLAEIYDVGPEREIVALIVLGWPAQEAIPTPRRTDIATFLG
jgi:nitroreductase